MSQHQTNTTPSNGVKRPEHPAPDAEVVPQQEPQQEQAKRRSFTTAYKLRILAEADRCRKPGEIGALLRREGLYSSNLTAWRRRREAGELGTKKRGKPALDPAAKEMKKLRLENERLQKRLEKAETIIEVQKKLCALLGLSSEENPKSGTK